MMTDMEKQEIRRRNRERTVTLPDGTAVPRLGQGTWFLGENPAARDREIRTLRHGIELGMTLIDTAEMYGEGKAEQLVGEAIRGRRDELFLVSKVYPHNADRAHLFKSCEASLRRLKADRLDLYLLHWRGPVPLEETIDCMEKLKAEGKILRWGVSNFDVADMRELLACGGGDRCAVDQVLYHLGSRGIEFELLPYLRRHRIPVMAYCPIAQAGTLRRGLFTNPAVNRIAKAHGASPAQVLLAWCTRENDVAAIPKASSEGHAEQNAQSVTIELTPEELGELDRAYPKPARKEPLDVR